jgi:hypothetical protein
MAQYTCLYIDAHTHARTRAHTFKIKVIMERDKTIASVDDEIDIGKSKPVYPRSNRYMLCGCKITSIMFQLMKLTTFL